MMLLGSRLWVCKRWWRMVVPKPPVVPVRRMGEAGEAIVAFDSRDMIDRNLRVEYDDHVSFV
jgi:hypothetical protein